MRPTSPHAQPLVEQHGGRAGVERGLAARLLRQRCGEALVVELDRHIHDRLQATGERTRLARLAGVAAAQGAGNPTTTRSAPSSRTSAASRARPFRVPGRSTGSSGVASVPEGSDTATPQRALP